VPGADVSADVTLADDEFSHRRDLRRIMTREANITARESGAAVSCGSLDALRRAGGPDTADPGAAPGQAPEGCRGMFGALRAALADLRIGAQRPAVGRAVTLRGVQAGRFEGGLLTGRQGSSGRPGMGTQPSLGSRL
jgi:hypothetical protein